MKKPSRRSFLETSAATFAAAAFLRNRPIAFASGDEGGPIEYINPDVPKPKLPEYLGARHTQMVPATLDLAERARLAVNVLTESVDPEYDYEMFWIADLLSDPPIMFHTVDDHVQAKFFTALPLCRTASGSNQNMHVERALMHVLLKMQGPDGLIYLPTNGRPWALPPKPSVWAGLDYLPTGDHWCSLVMSGMHLNALCIYASMDPEGPWKDAANRLVDGLKKVIIVDGDSAYLFLNCTEPGKTVVKPKEPPKQFRAAVNGWPAYGLVQAYRLLGRKDALDLAHKMMRYIFLESGYFGPKGEFNPDVNHVIHFHAHTRQIDSALALLTCIEDKELHERVVKAYAYAYLKGNTTVGFFPEWLHERARPASSEICEVADMIGCALKLCRLGYDKWDDVDRWTRNQFAECQLVHTHWLEDGHFEPADREKEPLPAAGCEPGVYSTTDRVAQRMVGAFSGWPSANDWVHGKGWSIMHCCTGNGTRTIYQVWQDIVQFEEGHLRVNLLMNRASPWADVHSHLPFTGRVDVHIKEDLSLSIRLPGWVDLEEIQFTVNGEPGSTSTYGRYVQIGWVNAGAEVRVVFPLEERTEELEIEGHTYTVTLRGHDVVHMHPAGTNNPLYQKAHFRNGKTLWKRAERWVPEKEIDWI